jgi:glycerol-3-phosphate acyltransferase PlsX
MFLGLNGISIKSHGSANAKGFKNAIDVAYKLAQNNIIEKISSKIVK